MRSIVKIFVMVSITSTAISARAEWPPRDIEVKSGRICVDHNLANNLDVKRRIEILKTVVLASQADRVVIAESSNDNERVINRVVVKKPVHISSSLEGGGEELLGSSSVLKICLDISEAVAPTVSAQSVQESTKKPSDYLSGGASLPGMTNEKPQVTAPTYR
jgi:hypothetical protein